MDTGLLNVGTILIPYYFRIHTRGNRALLYWNQRENLLSKRAPGGRKMAPVCHGVNTIYKLDGTVALPEQLWEYMSNLQVRHK